MTRTLGIKAALLLVPVLFLVSLGTFFMIDLVPGDPAFNVLGPNATQRTTLRVPPRAGLRQAGAAALRPLAVEGAAR